MESRWDERDAAAFTGEVMQLCYASRLLGQDPALVLHGGGNTSVKTAERDRFGRHRAVLWVKGSGADLATIGPEGFTPLLLDHVRELAALDRLSDTDMAAELLGARTNPASAAPSVESILHAVIPARFVVHTHADALLALTNTPAGPELVREAYGRGVVIVPYVMPGFELARVCTLALGNRTGATGMVLMNHGLFSWGDSARVAYEGMMELALRAEARLPPRPAPAAGPAPQPAPADLAEVRRAASEAAGAPLVMTRDGSGEAVAFARRPDLADIALQGPVTPDHVLRTKRLPLLGRDVASYVAGYEDAFARFAAARPGQLTMLDPAPRVVIDPEWGVCTLGRTVAEARMVADIHRHTRDVIERAVALGGYQALPEEDILRVEYWELEQAKLGRLPRPATLTGEVALVTGTASGIGRACVDALVARGAVVGGVDIAGNTVDLPAFLPIQGDVTDAQAMERAVAATVDAFGGLDMLIVNAGIFPATGRLEELDVNEWRRAMSVNAEAAAVLLRLAHPLLRLAPRGGRVVVVGTRNVAAPGPGAVAYSASKAAVTQVARVAALEWAGDGVRVNVVHPDAVFDTGLWSDDLIAQRAAAYGLSPEAYRSRNLLGVEVRAADVAAVVAELCGPAFSRVTGAHIPIDGGHERVI